MSKIRRAMRYGKELDSRFRGQNYYYHLDTAIKQVLIGKVYIKGDECEWRELPSSPVIKDSHLDGTTKFLLSKS